MGFEPEEIAKFPWFADVSLGSRAAIAEHLELRTVGRGCVLFDEASAGGLYLVTQGRFKVIRSPHTGRGSTLMVMGPGDILSDLPIIDPRPRLVSATALVESQAGWIDEDSLSDLVDRYQDISALLLRVVARCLRRMASAMSDIVSAEIPQRVAKALLSLALQFGTLERNGTVDVDHGLTQGELAQLVGASRESVNKVLSTFASRGWISVHSRSFVVLDPGSLEIAAGWKERSNRPEGRGARLFAVS